MGNVLSVLSLHSLCLRDYHGKPTSYDSRSRDSFCMYLKAAHACTDWDSQQKRSRSSLLYTTLLYPLLGGFVDQVGFVPPPHFRVAFDESLSSDGCFVLAETSVCFDDASECHA